MHERDRSIFVHSVPPAWFISIDWNSVSLVLWSHLLDFSSRRQLCLSSCQCYDKVAVPRVNYCTLSWYVEEFWYSCCESVLAILAENYPLFCSVTLSGSRKRKNALLPTDFRQFFAFPHFCVKVGMGLMDAEVVTSEAAQSIYCCI